MGSGVHDSYTFHCGLVGYFTSPGIDPADRRDRRNTLAKRGKRNCQSSEAKSFFTVGQTYITLVITNARACSRVRVYDCICTFVGAFVYVRACVRESVRACM